MNKTTTEIIKIPVFMTDNDARLFLDFQRYYEVFSMLIAKKVFNQKGATITIHFDKNGEIRGITRADVLYAYGSKFDNENEKE